MEIFIILVIIFVIIGFFSSQKKSCNKEIQNSFLNNIKVGTYSLKLIEPGDNKIALLKIIRECTNLGLKEAKDMIDNFPINILENIDYLGAVQLKENIEKTGAKVELINNAIFEIIIDESDCEETDDEGDENYVEEEVFIEESLCNGCNVCVNVCPKKAIDKAYENEPASIDYGKCDNCKVCVNSCPNKAIYVDR